jgi:hypothetical protein
MAREGSSITSLCIETAIARYGVVKGGRLGGRVAMFVYQWCHYMELHDGAEPASVGKFAAWAGGNRQHAYRHMEEFRDLFPGETTPARAFAGLPLMGADRDSAGALAL